MNSWTPYCGPGATPADLASRWNVDPVLIIALTAAALGLAWLRPDVRRLWLAAAFAVLMVSFVSPLCALASALFSARTVHHLLLVAVAAPLLAGALHLRARAIGAATLAQAVVFWLWHAPDAYGWALSDDFAYGLMQLSLLGSAVWFWSAVRRAGAPAAVAALLATTVQMGLLGALIALGDQPLYAPHLLTTQSWGLTPLEDQQAAGLLMWAPALGLYLAVALRKLARLIGPAHSGAAVP